MLQGSLFLINSKQITVLGILKLKKNIQLKNNQDLFTQNVELEETNKR